METLAHAGRHVESALQGAEPHHVWNVVAEKPQGPEAREQRASGTASRITLHSCGGPVDSAPSGRKPRTWFLERLLRQTFTGAADSQTLPVPPANSVSEDRPRCN